MKTFTKLIFNAFPSNNKQSTGPNTSAKYQLKRTRTKDCYTTLAISCSELIYKGLALSSLHGYRLLDNYMVTGEC